MSDLTESDFALWKTHPVTLAVMQVLAKKREALRQDWEGGSFTRDSVETSMLVNVSNVGTCKGYAFVQDLDFEQLEGELNE